MISRWTPRDILCNFFIVLKRILKKQSKLGTQFQKKKYYEEDYYWKFVPGNSANITTGYIEQLQRLVDNSLKSGMV